MRAAVILLALTAAAVAAPVDFARDVRPIFDRHCAECHGDKKQKSGLRLDVKAAAFKGGDGEGPSIVAGKAKESPLIRFVASADPEQRMPPKGDPLSPEEIATLTRWIDEGAAWPDGIDRVKNQFFGGAELARLDEMDALPVADHADIYADVHERLSGALSDVHAD